MYGRSNYIRSDGMSWEASESEVAAYLSKKTLVVGIRKMNRDVSTLMQIYGLFLYN